MAEAMDIDPTDDNFNMVSNQIMSPKQKKRLEYLLKQAEIFTHFVDNSPKQTAKRKLARNRNDKKPKNRRHTNNSSFEEEEEDDDQIVGTRFEATPPYIKGEMRDYQLRGLNWLISLYERGINGILADEMGLGKTLQTISVLGFLKSNKKINGPFLVVGPKSTLRNWFNEVNRFCPTLKPITLIGDKEARKETIQNMQKKGSWDVCLTTYEMILAERSFLKRYRWEYLVIDEAHRMKNENSKLSTILREFDAVSRLLLTGTPLQNNLHELWALLNFLLPDVFASADDFDTWFDSNDCLRGNNNVADRLRDILRPFMLRRIKADVEKSLLPKIELKLFVGLSEIQRELYKKVLVKELTKLNAMGEESTKAINNIVMELRKVANHPYLIEGVEPGPPFTTDEHLINCCGKMMVLDKLLMKLKEQGSRVVLFSQFVIMLDILEDFLDFRGHEYRRLDGNTPYEDRGKDIDDFNAENSNIFVYAISTRAGGLGINLATADTVIIYDSDWNPQPDFQAIDRVHRIGQKKQVRVFRLITENTVDERIVQRAEIKVRLDKMVIQQGRNVDKHLTELTKGMKRDMIRFGADQIMSPNAADVIDVDIDKILKEGEIKTATENEKYAKYGESELRKLTLEEASSVSVYEFEGIDFRQMKNKAKDNGSYGFRQRKAAAYGSQQGDGSSGSVPRNMKFLPDFQFYPKELLEMREDDGWVNMAIDTDAKTKLVEKGFPNWKRSDFKTFCDAMAKYGRNSLKEIAAELPEKSLEDVTKYHTMFWKRGESELQDFARYVSAVEKYQNKKQKEEENRIKPMVVIEAVHWKMENVHSHHDFTVKFIRNTLYTKEHDYFILTSLLKHGIYNADAFTLIHREISITRKFNFDWYIRSRKASEIRDHAQQLLNAIYKEYKMVTERLASSGTAPTINRKPLHQKNSIA